MDRKTTRPPYECARSVVFMVVDKQISVSNWNKRRPIYSVSQKHTLKDINIFSPSEDYYLFHWMISQELKLKLAPTTLLLRYLLAMEIITATTGLIEQRCGYQQHFLSSRA